MNKSIISLCLLLSTILLSADTFINPLPASVKSTDNGGVKSAIDAYKDGVGAELIDKPGIATDNSGMNILVYKYGEAAKTSNQSIVNQVTNTLGVSVADLALASNISGNNPNTNGTVCDDGVIATIGETWLNGVCQGGLLSSITSLSSVPATSKATFTFNGGMSAFGCSHSVLFDNNLVGGSSGSYTGYLHTTAGKYVDITVNSDFRIWSYLDYSGWLAYNSSLKFVNQATGLTVANTQKGIYRSTSIIKWSLGSGIIPAGRYTIYADTDGQALSAQRIDSEWFIEKVN